MTITRQDAWTEEEDELLANTVLAHIKEGSTQLAAFEEVGNKLYRTSAACGFRWNSYVRKKMKQEIEVAKKQRKEWKQERVEQGFNKKDDAVGMHSIHYIKKVDNEDVSLDFHTIIEYLSGLYEKANVASDDYQGQIKDLQKKCTWLEKENDNLKQKLQKIQKEYITIISVLDKAKEFVDNTE